MTTAIEAIETMPLIPIESIRVDGGTQARAGLNLETVAEYAETWQELSYQQNGLSRMPPIVLFHDGSDYWLADGFHRLAAYKQFLENGKPSASPHALLADVKSGTRRDAVLYAAGANTEHGLRRTNADKRRAIEALLRDEEWRQWSDSEIARRCKVDHKTVAKIREELYPGISQDARTVERNGTTYQMTPATKLQKPNIPEQSAPAASEPFWQSLSASHPTAHLWAEIRPGYWKAACGITTRRALSGSTEAGHCSACTRATWTADLTCTGCGGAWGAHGSLVNASGRYCPACVAAGKGVATAEPNAWICEGCGQPQTGMKKPTPAICTSCALARISAIHVHRCDDCGADATGRANIGGILAWRCEACKRAAEQLERTQGAKKASPVDWNAVAKLTYAIGATNDAGVAFAKWLELGRLLAASEPLTAACHALRLIESVVSKLPKTECLEDLSVAISDLNECEEGTEARHWCNVGWALLDLEAGD